MKVRVLETGKYMGLNGKAVQVAKGKTLETRSWYGKQLVDDGLAEFVGDAKKAADAEAKAKKDAEAKAKKDAEKAKKAAEKAAKAESEETPQE